MSKPLTIDEILDDAFAGLTSNTRNLMKRDKLQAQIEAMLADILGPDLDMAGYSRSGGVGYARSYANDVKQLQRQHATKYNLTLKEGK